MKLEELSNRGAPEKQHETEAQVNQTEKGTCNKSQIGYFKSEIYIQSKTYICHPIPPSSGQLYSRPSPICNAGSEQSLVALKRTSRTNMFKVYS